LEHFADAGRGPGVVPLLPCGLRSRQNPRRGRRRIARVGRAGRLDQEDVHLAARDGAMLDALRHHEDFAGIERDGAIAQLDVERTLEHEKEIVGVVVLVPVPPN
jgi:hypothetical protein